MKTNEDIAGILNDIAFYLEMRSVPFKPRAYEKAAETIQALRTPVYETYEKGGIKAVEDIPGVGISIAEKIEEYLTTGRLKYYEQLKKKVPINIHELRAVEGLGPKKIKALYQKLKITSLKELEAAAKAGKIAKLATFGKKSEENILKGIGFVKKSGTRFLLGEVSREIRTLEERLRALPSVEKIIIAGSARRMKETIGDLDLLVISKTSKPVMDFFVNIPEVVRVLAHGETKSSIKLENGMEVDLRIVSAASYGAALHYFTGSKDHNVALREIAIQKGYKLNEYGLFKGAKVIAGKTEEDIYLALGMDFIPPEMREMQGEIALAMNHQLPNLISYKGLKGDLQVQTNWTDGKYSIYVMAKAAHDRGLKYIAITDHTKSLAMTRGLDEKRIKKQWTEIDAVNKALKVEGVDCMVLKGTECDILPNGTLDLPDRILSQFDVVGVSVHSRFSMTKKEQTERIVRAIKHPHVDILFHPTGRIIHKREAYQVDMEEIIRVAKETNTVLEIDSLPNRMDLNNEYIRQCVQRGVKMSIDSDAHTTDHFDYLEFGIGQARRGWATKDDIVNAWPLEKMKRMLK